MENKIGDKVIVTLGYSVEYEGTVVALAGDGFVKVKENGIWGKVKWVKDYNVEQIKQSNGK